MAVVVMSLVGLFSCSSTKHVPQGKLLLDKVKINVTDPHRDVETNQLANYLRQNANHRVLGGLKLQLAFYNISGKDSTKWFNRWIQRVGTPPVIYDSTLTEASAEQLHTALSNRGFMNNTVTYRVDADSVKHKAIVNYDITLGEPYYIRSIDYDIPDESLREIILADTSRFNVHSGDLLNFNHLDEWRQGITENLRNHGYYAFNKEYITFIADTAANSRAVDLTLNSRDPYRNDHMPYYTEHEPFYVRDVVYVTDYDPVAMHDGLWGADTVTMSSGVKVIEGSERYLRPDVLDECNHIEPGQLYNAEAITRTYRALGRLNILKQINIDVRPLGKVDGVLMVDTYVLLQPDKSQTVSVSLEGTNSEGDLGFGVGLDYEHRNIFKGAEVLSAKAKVSYESISGNIGGLINNNYSEYSTELGIRFLKNYVDSLVVVPNDKLLTISEKNTTIIDAFKRADEVLKDGVEGIASLISDDGLINLDFADVKTVMTDRGIAHMGVGVASGEKRVEDAIKNAVESPLLETTIKGAKAVLLNVMGGYDLGMLEVNDAADLVAKEADEDAIIIFGTSVKENMENEVRVTVIATGFEDDLDKVKIPGKGLDGDKKEETNKVELEETVEEIKSETGYDPKNDFPIPDFLKNMGTGSLNL